MSRSDSPRLARTPNADPGSEPRSRRPWWLVPIASGLIVAVVIAVVVFVLTRASVAGNWYGPGNFEGTNGTVAAATYLQLSQQFTGSISGSGELCVSTAQGIVKTPVTVTGSISGTTLKLTLNLASAGTVPLARTLELQGALADDGLTLSGTSPQGVLTLQKGFQVDYDNACINLPPVTNEGNS